MRRDFSVLNINSRHYRIVFKVFCCLINLLAAVRITTVRHTTDRQSAIDVVTNHHQTGGLLSVAQHAMGRLYVLIVDERAI